MTIWKLQLIQMHPVSRTYKIILACVILLLVTGCTSKKEEILMSDWLEMIVIEMNLPEAESKKSAFLNIDDSNPSFESVQSAFEWGVIDNSISLDLGQVITKEWAAYTLVNLINDENVQLKIKDSSKSNFPDHIAKSVSLGMFSLDKRQCFNPKEVLSKEEAIQKLNIVKNYINNYQNTEPIYDYEFSERVVEIEAPLEYDESTKEAVLKKDSPINPGSIVHWKDKQDYFYEVNEVTVLDDCKKAKLNEVDFSEIYNSFEIDDSFEINFNNAEIELYDNFQFENEQFNLVNLVSKDIEYGGFKGTVSADHAGVSVKLKKDNLKAEAKLYKVKPTVRWKTNSNGIEDAYFKVVFNSTELIKLESEIQRNFYSTFEKIERNNFISSLLQSFKSSKDMEGTTIPICQIKVPFPNIPLLNLTMQLKLHLYTSGKIELVLVNNHQVGIEIKNNKLRTFSESDRDADFILKSSVSTTLGLTTGVSAANIDLMNIFVKGGIKGYIDTIVHVYDTEGSKTENSVSVELEQADMAAQNRDDVKVCGNINLHWILDLGVNTSKTVAGKFGLSKTWNALNENNSKLILNKKTHIENWQFMERCTRKSRLPSSSSDVLESDKIVLDKFNLIVDLSEVKKIKIVKLPKGISKKDLIFESSNPLICTIDENGVVKPIKRGSSIIKIKTKDAKYEVSCNILVTDKKKYDLSIT